MLEGEMDEDEFEVKPEEYKKHHNLAYEQRRTFVLNMVQGKSGNSTLIDYTYDEEVRDHYCIFSRHSNASRPNKFFQKSG